MNDPKSKCHKYFNILPQFDRYLDHKIASTIRDYDGVSKKIPV